jgi:hypothetical protein
MQLPIGKRDVKTVEVTYSVGTRARKKFVFGALCIMESMAYIIERQCYPTAPASPDLPYAAAEKLAAFVYPDFAHDTLNVLALCDISLQDINPGPFFYETLLKIKQRKVKFNAPEEVYAFAIANHPPFNFNGATNLDALFLQNGQLAADQLRKYFNDAHFDPIKDWLETLINTGVQYRVRNKTFPLDIARGGSIAKNLPFTHFINTIGSPLVTNDLNETTLHNPRSTASLNYSLVWALDQIHMVFWGVQKNCEMIELCKQSKINVDHRCSDSPWERANDRLPNCPFALMWRHWKLAGYYPQP